MENYLQQLNKSQYEAVTTTSGPLLVLSGAGTGKTKVLTTRIAYIISQNLCSPWEILAITFTNKASNEMKSRIYEMVGDIAQTMWVGTFHSICLKFLRSHINLLGYDTNFIVFDESDQKLLLKKILQEYNIDIKENPPGYAVELISRLKDDLIYAGTPQASFLHADFANGKFSQIYSKYQERLKALNAVDFGDIIILSLKLFKEFPDIAERYQDKFKYVLVDEYQDTNKAQYELLKILSSKYKNLCVVGDDDQSIYSWRGAQIENILRFEHDFKNSKIIKLEINYRSTKHILSCASTLISNNKNRHQKTLYPHREEEAHKVEVHSFSNDESEAYYIANAISNLRNKGYNLNEIALLVRTTSLTRIFEDRFLKSGIAYKIVGGTKFYERAEIKDIICYLRLIVNPSDNIAFERVVNSPKRGLGDAVLSKLNQAASRSNKSLFEITRMLLDSDTFPAKQKQQLIIFINLILEYQTSSMSAGDLTKDLIEKSGYLKALQEDKKPESPARIENLKELVNVLKYKFETIPEFLEYISLIMDSDDAIEADKVSIMTMHASKGLEFETVFLPSWEETIFPSDRSLKEEGESGLEEERRLAYVAITRAKKYCIISHCSTRFIYGQTQGSNPSIFLINLPKDDISLFSHREQAEHKTFKYFKTQKRTQKPEIRSNLSNRLVFHAEYGVGKVLLSNKTTVTVLFDSNVIKNLMLHEVEILEKD